MKKLTLTLALLISAAFALPSMAAGDKSCGQIDCYDFSVDLKDKESLQRGAATFVNYCMGCHSAKFARYERVADDLDIPLALMNGNLIFDGSKVGSLMENAMPGDLAKNWFGATPPDLTLVTRAKGALGDSARGPKWLYTYLMTFYLDEKRPLGVNNLVFKDVGMPHALLELQGEQRCLPNDDHGHCELELMGEGGSQTAAEYEQTVGDLTNFLAYMAEPMALERKRIGIFVMFFLGFFFIFAWLLNREYWKDVH